MTKQDSHHGKFDDKTALLQFACVRHMLMKKWQNNIAITMSDDAYKQYVKERKIVDDVLQTYCIGDEMTVMMKMFHRLKKDGMTEEDIARTAQQCLAFSTIQRVVAAKLKKEGMTL